MSLNFLIINRKGMNKKLGLLLIVCGMPLFVLAQKTDFGIWYQASLEHEIINKLDVELSGSVRTFKNAGKIDNKFLEAGLQYKFSKNFTSSFSYRIISKYEDDKEYHLRHKWFADLRGILPVNNFEFSARLRFQGTTRTYVEDTDGSGSRYFGRLRIRAMYDSPSFFINPYLYAESFTPVFSEYDKIIGEYWLGSGFELKITGKQAFEIEYIFQRDMLPKVRDLHVLSLNYNIRF